MNTCRLIYIFSRIKGFLIGYIVTERCVINTPFPLWPVNQIFPQPRTNLHIFSFLAQNPTPIATGTVYVK